MIGPARPFERVKWFEGSALTERDLTIAVEYEARLLELHVRAMHETWGVANGLGLRRSDDALELLVSPGYGYSCRGEALILASPARTAPPPSPAPAVFDLVLAPAPPPETLPCERPGTCTEERFASRSMLRWERAGAAFVAAGSPLAPGIHLGDELPLGRVVRLPSGILIGPQLSERRIARGLVRPHVAFGVLRPAELEWSASGFDLMATVSTRTAGFNTSPFYFVTLSGVDWPAGVFGPLLSIGQATSTSFRIHLVFGGLVAASLPTLGRLAGRATVSWVGVEPVTGCPPTLSLFQLLALGLSPADLATKWSGTLAEISKVGP